MPFDDSWDTSTLLCHGLLALAAEKDSYVYTGADVANTIQTVVGTIAESGRLLLVQTLLRGPQTSGEASDEEALSRRGVAGMSPLVGLYYFAPVCAILNIFVALVVESRDFNFADVHRIGYSVLMLNCLLAFLLNVAGVFLVSITLPSRCLCLTCQCEEYACLLTLWRDRSARRRL